MGKLTDQLDALYEAACRGGSGLLEDWKNEIGRAKSLAENTTATDRGTAGSMVPVPNPGTENPTKVTPQREAQLKRLAGRIARELFTARDSQKTTRVGRLVMAFPRQGTDEQGMNREMQTGTGWGEGPVRDVILCHLLRAEERQEAP